MCRLPAVPGILFTPRYVKLPTTRLDNLMIQNIYLLSHSTQEYKRDEDQYHRRPSYGVKAWLSGCSLCNLRDFQ